MVFQWESGSQQLKSQAVSPALPLMWQTGREKTDSVNSKKENL